MENAKPSKILGGTGYIGKFLVKASISMGHPTYAYARPTTALATESNQKLRDHFCSIGVTLVEGTLEEHGKLVSTMTKVDVVISELPYPQVLDQLKNVEAVIAAGNIERFVPSDFRCEEYRIGALPSFEAFLEKKRTIRKAIELAGVPFTYVSAIAVGRTSSTSYFTHMTDHERMSSSTKLAEQKVDLVLVELMKQKVDV